MLFNNYFVYFKIHILYLYFYGDEQITDIKNQNIRLDYLISLSLKASEFHILNIAVLEEVETEASLKVCLQFSSVS